MRQLTKILIFTPKQSPRLTFTIYQVFTMWLGLSVEWTDNKARYLNYHGVKINYSTATLFEGDLLIPASSFLKEKTIKNYPFTPYYYNKIPALFPFPIKSASFPFDILATIFFHLSRYEEYLSFQADEHGRFPASESWCSQYGCLQLPVVDLLLSNLKHKLKENFLDLQFKEQKFGFLPTYDVDMAWAFKYKGWKRWLGGYAEDLQKGRWHFLKSRIKTQINLQRDPFQTFELLADWQQKYDLGAVYFFLLGDHSKYDKNNLPSNPHFQHLLVNIANRQNVGLHPSYLSNEKTSLLALEKKRLEGIIEKTITCSRQHFLKLHLPTTYKRLIEAGFTMDYSMGYATDIGFRAGTSLPFYWYDLEKEERTALLIHPFQVMDVTLKDYLQLSPPQAKERVDNIIKEIKAVNGIFCSLWHNSSFSEIGQWEGWEEVYIHLLNSSCDKKSE